MSVILLKFIIALVISILTGPIGIVIMIIITIAELLM